MQPYLFWCCLSVSWVGYLKQFKQSFFKMQKAKPVHPTEWQPECLKHPYLHRTPWSRGSRWCRLFWNWATSGDWCWPQGLELWYQTGYKQRQEDKFLKNRSLRCGSVVYYNYYYNNKQCLHFLQWPRCHFNSKMSCFCSIIKKLATTSRAKTKPKFTTAWESILLHFSHT